MNIQIFLNETEITPYVTTYSRNQDICSGIGTLELTVSIDFPYAMTVWDSIIIEELGNRMGSYYISSYTKDVPNATIKISGQDETKKLADFFVSDLHEIKTPTYTKTWISNYLTEATVSYTYDASGIGTLMSNNTTIGRGSALELVTDLLKQSGWFLYSDANNVVHIGKATTDSTNIKEYITDDEILSLETAKDDKMLRNRVVLWGNGNPNTQRWVFADVHAHTPWNYSDSDLRSVLVCAPTMSDAASANKVASTLLKETTKITYVKTVKLGGLYNLHIGDTVYVNSKYHNGVSLITTVNVTVSPDGAITTLILDERCPRLLGWFDYGGYVYIGTQGSGVWRRPLKYDYTWENFSTGLTNLNIIDLYVNDGVFVCVGDAGELFYRLMNQATWYRFNSPVGFQGVGATYANSEVECSSCAINRTNNHVLATFNTNNAITRILDYPILTSGAEAWLVDFNGYRDYTISGIDVDGNRNTYAYDLDCNGSEIFISAIHLATTSGTSWDFSSFDDNWVFSPTNPEHDYEYWTGTYDISDEMLSMTAAQYQGALVVPPHWRYTYDVGNEPTIVSGDSFTLLVSRCYNESIGMATYPIHISVHFLGTPGSTHTSSFTWTTTVHPAGPATCDEKEFTGVIDDAHIGKQIEYVEIGTDYLFDADVADEGVNILAFDATWNASIDWTHTVQTPCILKYNGTTFSNRTLTPSLLKIESSKDNPVIGYGGNTYFNFGAVEESFDNGNSWLPAYPIAPSGDGTFYTCARVFDIITVSGVVYSGYDAESNYSRCVIFAKAAYSGETDRLTILDTSYNLNPSGVIGGTLTYTNSYIVLISGYPYMQHFVYDDIVAVSGSCISQVETTNFHDVPYFLICTSGENPLFYQKDGGDYYDIINPDWFLTVANLPSSHINIIRADDGI